MAHRRVKNIDYADDDYSDEDYDDTYAEEANGQDEVSEHDKEQLTTGTKQVREALGTQAEFFTDKEIQDALWHYYYDVGKSVTYLKNSQKPSTNQQTPKAKQPSRFDQAASNAATQSPSNGTSNFSTGMMGIYSELLASPVCEPFSAFASTPWGKIPSANQGIITTERVRPAGRLLGGSAKPSKLAALAAARKKKEEEKRAEAGSGVPNDDKDKVASLLGKLSVKSDQPDVGHSAVSQPKQPQKGFPIKRKESEPTVQPSVEPVVEEKLPLQIEESVQKPQISATPAGPSTFASTMFGLNNMPSEEGVSLTATSLDSESAGDVRSVAFPLPYLSNKAFNNRDPFAKPSPDDVVLNAQSKAKGLKQTKAQPSSTGSSTPSSVANGVASLSVQDLPKPKSKNLNVVQEFQKANMKNTSSFVVVGHVDHGKSTLMGRLLYDLRVIDEKSVEKLRRESKKVGKSSFALAWVMDATSDERERGVTVDIATNYFETEKSKFTILDAPGHQDFIPNMISGASQADFAVLVIDSSTNSFESGLRGQTKEHALLVRSMGVQRLIVAVNKMDMAGWSEERFTEIQQQMTAFLTSANFAAKNISFIPCAGLTGDNILNPVTEKTASWYKGNTLVQELDSVEPTKRALEKPLRLTVSEVFRSSPNNPVSISGRIDSGSLQVGEAIRIMPSGESALIRTLDADSEPSDWAVAGQIVTLNLADIDPVHLKPGDIVCHPTKPILNVKRFTTKILTFEHVMPMYVDVHRGPLQAGGKIIELVAALDKSSGKVTKKKPRVIQPGAVARVVVELESELPLEAPSKVILRADGHTVAAGLVES